MRVLAIDDDSLILRALRRVFRGSIEVTSDGPHGVDLAAKFQPSVALVDMSLKTRSDGLDLIPRIIRVCPSCKVVIFTAHTTTEFRRQAFAAGAAGYIDKMHLSRIGEIVEDIVTSDRHSRTVAADILH